MGYYSLFITPLQYRTVKRLPEKRNGRSREKILVYFCPFLRSVYLHHLVDDAADGIRRLPLHPLGGVGVGVQGGARAVVAQGGG